MQLHKKQSAAGAFGLRLFIYAFTELIFTGISSHVLPSSVLPARFTSFTCASAAGTGVNAIPSLEEKRDFSPQTLIPNIGDLFLYDWLCAWTRLAANRAPDWELEIRKGMRESV